METGHHRKGARSMADIPPDVLNAISTGQAATVNLVEYLAADLTKLLPAVAAQIGFDIRHPELLKTVTLLPALKPMQRHWAIAKALLTVIGNSEEFERRLANHISDLARQWAALIVGLRPGIDLSDRLLMARPYAADTHFGVREMAWLAVRNPVADEVPLALELLLPWTEESDPNLRRFASELTRPRGVWCAHIEQLKDNPELGAKLLENLRADTSRYVQNSVGNWLNDASKTRPEWVVGICRSWLQDSTIKSTQYICQRGMRSIRVSQNTKLNTNYGYR